VKEYKEYKESEEFKERIQEPESRSQEEPAVERASLARPW
jgi:hypothetical protein